MEYLRFGRTLVPEGGLFDDADTAIDFVSALEQDVLSEQLQDLGFTTDDDGILNVLINNKRFFITNSALKDLCKLLKVPASYINKFPGQALVLKNLNKNPYLLDNAEIVKLVIWESEEFPVIAGVLPGQDPAMSASELLKLMKDEDVFERDNCKLDQIAVTGEELVCYFYLPEELSHEGYGFNLGYAIHYSPVRASDTVVYPFVKMTIVSGNGEPFDFDFESTRKLFIAKRKKEDFLNKTVEMVQTYSGEDLGVYYEEAVKYAMVARNVDTIKYAVLKNFRGRATSTYNYSGFKIDANQVAEETIPEYKEFYTANKEELKSVPTYSANNLPVGFYVPIFLNRIFTMQPNIENANFMVRYRKTIAGVLNKMLDEVGDLVVDTSAAPAKQL